MHDVAIHDAKVRLCGVVGEEHVSDVAHEVAPYTRDSWPRMLLDARGRQPYSILVSPKTTEAVQHVVEIARQEGFAILVRGGGSGVCGAIAIRDRRPYIILSTQRLSDLHSLDEQNMLVEVGSGINGGDLEAMLNARGYTLGHFPASLHVSTVGGWIAARSSGQTSNRYGRFDQMVRKMDVVLGTGEVLTLDDRAGTVGPDLMPAIFGSEGTLGVVTSVSVAIKPLPAIQRFAHFSFTDVGEAAEAARAIVLSGYDAPIVRVYDVLDAKFNLLAKEHGDTAIAGAKRRVLERDWKMVALTRLADRLGRARMIVVTEDHEGNAERAEGEHQSITALCESLGAKREDEDAARRWFDHRYALSFEKIERLVEQGCFVDTMDLTVPWDKIGVVHKEIRKRISPLAFSFAHLSHVSLHGACMYVTFIGKRERGQHAAYDLIWRDVLEYCLSQGVGISDHHGVGDVKRFAFLRHRGSVWRDVFRALKERCDPDNVLAPGHLR